MRIAVWASKTTLVINIILSPIISVMNEMGCLYSRPESLPRTRYEKKENILMCIFVYLGRDHIRIPESIKSERNPSIILKSK
jgi:hypothetical protein